MSRFDRFTTERIRTETMAGLDQSNFDLFGSFGVALLEDELLTATDYLTEQKLLKQVVLLQLLSKTKQTESGQLNEIH